MQLGLSPQDRPSRKRVLEAPQEAARRPERPAGRRSGPRQSARGGKGGNLLENPTFREMNRVWVRCSKTAALRFSKTILDPFFSFLPLRYEYREFDARREDFNRCGLNTPGCRLGTRIWNCSSTRSTRSDASASSLINSAAARSSARG